MIRKCNCPYCILARRIKAERPTWNEETESIVTEIWNRMEAAETDLEAWEKGMLGRPEHLPKLEEVEGEQQ